MRMKPYDNSAETLKELLQWIKLINSFNKDWSRDIGWLIEFRFNNQDWILSLINKKLIARSDFDKIVEWFNNLISVYNWDKWNIKVKYFWDNLIFDKICNAFYRLSFQFNEYDDEYLKYYNPSSISYKRIKTLLCIRSFRWKPSEFLDMYIEITRMLYDIIEAYPQNTNYCINLWLDWLSIIFPNINSNDERELNFKHTTVEEKFNIIAKCCDRKFFNVLLSSRQFKYWILQWPNKYDEREENLEWIKKIITWIIDRYKLNEFSKDETEKLLNRHIEAFKKCVELEESVIRWYINFLKSNNYYKWKNNNSLNGIDLWEIYLKIKYKYFWDLLNDWDFYVCDNDDANDIVKFFNDKLLNSEIINTKNLFAFVDEQTEKKLNELRLSLDKIDWFNFLVFNMPRDLRIAYNMYRFQNDDLYGSTSLVVDFLIEWYNLIYKLDVNYPEDQIKSVVASKKEDYDIQKLLTIIEDKDRLLFEKERAIERYIQQSVTLQNKIEDMNMVLKKHGVDLQKDENKQSDEDLLIEKRSYYRIVVIWWSPNSIKWFKSLMKNSLYIERLNKYHHLNVKQFDLKWTYEMQKDNRFINQIQNWLDFWATDFVIVLQSDHETSLFNLLNNPYYSSRLTCFWELDEDWKISKINQKFSPEKFDLYLEKALKKYEKMSETNSKLLE